MTVVMWTRGAFVYASLRCGGPGSREAYPAKQQGKVVYGIAEQAPARRRSAMERGLDLSERAT